MGQDRLKSERREGQRGGLRHGRREKLPGRENTGHGLGRTLAHSRKARQAARQDTGRKMAPMRPEKWAEAQIMQSHQSC